LSVCHVCVIAERNRWQCTAGALWTPWCCHLRYNRHWAGYGCVGLKGTRVWSTLCVHIVCALLQSRLYIIATTHSGVWYQFMHTVCMICMWASLLFIVSVMLC